MTDLAVRNSQLLRLPPKKQKDPEQPFEPLNLTLLDDLPQIRIENLVISNFQNSVGDTVRYDAQGEINIRPGEIATRLHGASENKSDLVDLNLDFAPKKQRLRLNLSVESGLNGVVAQLLKANGPVQISASSNPSQAQTIVELQGKFGDLGAIQGAVNLSFTNAAATQFNIQFEPGPSLSSNEEFGAPIALLGSIQTTRRGNLINISNFQSAVGNINGIIEWTNRRNFADELSAKLNGTFADSYQKDLQSLLGENFEAEINLKRRRKNYAVRSALSPPNG